MKEHYAMFRCDFCGANSMLGMQSERIFPCPGGWLHIQVREGQDLLQHTFCGWHCLDEWRNKHRVFLGYDSDRIAAHRATVKKWNAVTERADEH